MAARMQKYRRDKSAPRVARARGVEAGGDARWNWQVGSFGPTTLLVLIGGVLGFAALQVYRAQVDPRVTYLGAAEGNAEWIRPQENFVLSIYVRRESAAAFCHRFELQKPIAHPRLHVRALHQFEVQLDGQPVFTGSARWDAWKQLYELPLARELSPGPHELVLLVKARHAHPAVMAYSSELGLRTAADWIVLYDGSVQPAALASDRILPEIAQAYPTVAHCFFAISPWLAIVFVVTLSGVWWSGVPSAARLLPSEPAAVVRWCLIAAWIILAINNLWRIPPGQGYDQQAHREYVQYIARYGALPLATDGWQMFQSPLFYLVAAPFYAVLSITLVDDTVFRLLRVIPLLCGLAQIELVYRIARAVFPRQQDLQIVATLVGGLMPMHVYISQVIGNEPLAGCLTSLTLLLCVVLLTKGGESSSWKFFVALGAVWGLALLAKVTPIVLAPLILSAVVLSARAAGKSFTTAALQTGVVFGVCLLVSGWYYARNLYFLGTPFAGGWDAASGNVWWQDPSYRTWSQMTSFGVSLTQPVYSGCWSMWDALHSTLWLDGFTSGGAHLPANLAWNYRWMMAGAWLGVVPLMLILVGVLLTCRSMMHGTTTVLWIAVAALLIYLAVFVDLYFRLPVYSTGKATYLLGLVPLLAVLAAAGAAPLLQHRVLRSITFASLACWACAAYCAYFSLF